MDEVVCQGLCSRTFRDKDAAIARGELFATGVCATCYAEYARNPQTCFGKQTANGKRLANPKDPVCQQCPEFPVCKDWKNPVIEPKSTKEGKMPKKQKEAAAAPVEETLDFEPLEETETEEAAQPAAAPAPKRASKKQPPPAPPAPAAKKKAAPAPPAPAAKKKAAPAEGEVPYSPYQHGSARDIMFRMMRAKFVTKEEVVTAAKDACKDPAAVFAGNFHPRRNDRDNNQKYFKWDVVQKGDKFKITVQ